MSNSSDKKEGRISLYTRLNKGRHEKYKIYLVKQYGDSSDEAERLLCEDEDREKWEAAIMRENQKKKKSCCERVHDFLCRCCKKKKNIQNGAAILDDFKRKSFFEKID